MWNDLKFMDKLDKYSKPKYLLIALRYLYTNDTENDLARFFGYIDRTRIRTHAKEYANKIQWLLQLKMLSFEEADDGLVYFMSVDGTHCRIQEPRPFSKIWSSHKFGKAAALNYEVGLSINKNKLIWLHGPIPAGLKNDLDVAKERLIPKMQKFNQGKELKRCIIADDIYKDEAVNNAFSNKMNLIQEMSPTLKIESWHAMKISIACSKVGRFLMRCFVLKILMSIRFVLRPSLLLSATNSTMEATNY